MLTPMGARAYREKVVKPFLGKILEMTKLVISREKNCFAELMKMRSELETVKEEKNLLREKMKI